MSWVDELIAWLKESHPNKDVHVYKNVLTGLRTDRVSQGCYLWDGEEQTHRRYTFQELERDLGGVSQADEFVQALLEVQYPPPTRSY